jgi:hypothetical protein
LKLSSAVASNEKEEQLRLLQVSDCGPSSWWLSLMALIRTY